MVLSVLRSVEDRGALDTAKRLRQRLASIFDLAEARELISSHPARVTKLLKKAPSLTW